MFRTIPNGRYRSAPDFSAFTHCPPPDFWRARNSLTQRAIGPESIVTTELDASGLQAGDTAGLALLNMPYAWIVLSRGADGFAVEQFDQVSGKALRAPMRSAHLWLRVHCDFERKRRASAIAPTEESSSRSARSGRWCSNSGRFRASAMRCSTSMRAAPPGGHADFNDFTVAEPRSTGLAKPIPIGRFITLTNLANAHVLTADGARCRRSPEPVVPLPFA